MLNIAICDDSASDRAELRCLISAEMKRFGTCPPHMAEYAAGETLLEDLEEGYESFDLLFLDIFMGGCNGMTVARRLRGKGCRARLVFLTSTPDFAVESYEVEALGYLLKPLRQEKLAALLDKAFAPPKRAQIALRCGRETRYFFLDEIFWAESNRHITLLHLADGTFVTTAEKLGDVAEQLADARFLRCHQSYLVNMDYVIDVREDFHLKDGSVVPIRVRSRKEITEAYYRYFVAHTVSPRKEERV